jgi:hypothetical protein
MQRRTDQLALRGESGAWGGLDQLFSREWDHPVDGSPNLLGAAVWGLTPARGVINTICIIQIHLDHAVHRIAARPWSDLCELGLR